MEFVNPGNLDAQVGVMSRRLLALTWMMPPLIFPRSLQISRTLHAMSERGWKTTVISVPSDVEPFAVRDSRLETFYRGSYEIQYVEPREEIESSLFWLRIVRCILRTKNTRESNWIRRASAALCARIEIEKPEALISFAQPWINHQVALRVKRQYPQLPWVAHFSDPWVDSPYFSPPNEKARTAAIKQEREIIYAANAVIFTTEETSNLVMAKYPKALARKAHVVPHGYDSDLIRLIEPRPRPDKFTIVHTGNLYEKRQPYALLHALSTLSTELTTTELQVEFIGYAEQTMKDLVKQLNLDDIVLITPPLPFLESLAVAQSADLLLIIDAPAELSMFLPSKTMDYLSLGRSILALTPQEGALARVMGDLGFPTVDPTDAAGILVIVRESLARWRRAESVTPIPSNKILRAFDIREVVVVLEKVLLSVISDVEHKCA